MNNLERVALLMDTLGVATYDDDIDLSEITFGDIPETKTEMYGIHPDEDGTPLNLGVSRSMTDFPTAMRIFYKGNDDFYPSYLAIRAALVALHGYAGDGDINYITVDQSEVSDFGKNEAGHYEFSFDMTVHFTRLE